MAGSKNHCYANRGVVNTCGGSGVSEGLEVAGWHPGAGARVRHVGLTPGAIRGAVRSEQRARPRHWHLGIGGVAQISAFSTQSVPAHKKPRLAAETAGRGGGERSKFNAFFRALFKAFCKALFKAFCKGFQGQCATGVDPNRNTLIHLDTPACTGSCIPAQLLTQL